MQFIAEKRKSSTLLRVGLLAVLPVAWFLYLSGDVAGETAEAIFPKMKRISEGAYQMGDNRYMPDERPVHTVYLSAFYCDVHEVTTSKWEEVASWAEANGYEFDPRTKKAKKGPSWSPSPDTHPMNMVSWYDAVKWCNARSEMEGRTPAYYEDSNWQKVYRKGEVDLDNHIVNWLAPGYRLPTEAEWEKAARGGMDSFHYPWGDKLDGSKGNYRLSGDWFDNGSTPAGYFDGAQLIEYRSHSYGGERSSPRDMVNRYGLHDMFGNVNEWCWDWYDPHWYGSGVNALNPQALAPDVRGPDRSPQGTRSAGTRSLRGGSFQHETNSDNGYALRLAYRHQRLPKSALRHVGFRCVRPDVSEYSWEIAKDFGNSWKHLLWFGYFHETSTKWIYHAELGWLFRDAKNASSIWLWRKELGWVWTSRESFPYLHRHETGTWLRYRRGSTDPVVLYDYAEKKWTALN